MIQRKVFICSAIQQCQEKTNCCPHKNPHIKDERCVPRECRYAPGVQDIDCILYDPEKPRVPEPAAPAKTVFRDGDTIAVKMSGTLEPVTTLIEGETQEQGIKEAVKKQATKRPAKKSSKKVS